MSFVVIGIYSEIVG